MERIGSRSRYRPGILSDDFLRRTTGRPETTTLRPLQDLVRLVRIHNRLIFLLRGTPLFPHPGLFGDIVLVRGLLTSTHKRFGGEPGGRLVRDREGRRFGCGCGCGSFDTVRVRRSGGCGSRVRRIKRGRSRSTPPPFASVVLVVVVLVFQTGTSGSPGASDADVELQVRRTRDGRPTTAHHSFETQGSLSTFQIRDHVVSFLETLEFPIEPRRQR